MTQVIRSLPEWQAVREQLVRKGRTLGFVPTMGALHEGHLSLVRKSREENDLTLVSIFVNPTQFNDPKDLEKYPRTLERDLELLKGAGADFLLYPEYKDLYGDNYRYRVQENDFSRDLCGAHRPGHFDGVLTVVMKLLNIARAERAYFGEKDYQQLKLIEGMVEAFFVPTKIIGCPTLREPDGLAMSSRNGLLSPEERKRAPRFNEFLRANLPLESIREKLVEAGFEVDYVEERGRRRFGAVKIGNVRLIDNVPL